MLRTLVFLVLGLLATKAAVSESVLNNLDQLRWSARIVLLSVPGDANAQIAELKSQRAAVEERDIVWFIITGNGLETNYAGALSSDFVSGLEVRLAGEPTVVLIGKDGGVKLRADSLSLPTIFTRIDSMPMRQQEIRSGATDSSNSWSTFEASRDEMFEMLDRALSAE